MKGVLRGGWIDLVLGRRGVVRVGERLEGRGRRRMKG